MYSGNNMCSSNRSVDVKMMYYFRARQFFHCLAHHALHRIASSAQASRPDNPASEKVGAWALPSVPASGLHVIPWSVRETASVVVGVRAKNHRASSTSCSVSSTTHTKNLPLRRRHHGYQVFRSAASNPPPPPPLTPPPQVPHPPLPPRQSGVFSLIITTPSPRPPTDPPPLSAWPSGSPPSRPRTRPRSSRMSPS
jgi:hypothetical protein